MLNYNEIKPKKYVEIEGEPYEVLTSNILRKQQRKPVNQTKLKNLISGRVVEKAFHQSDSVNEAELEKKSLKYLYRKGEEVWLSEPDNPKNRISIPYSTIANELNYIVENDTIESVLYNAEIIGFRLPIKIKMEVIEAPPNIRGNTSAGGSKTVVVETGAKIVTPLFIETGNIIEVNTETGEYAGRISS